LLVAFQRQEANVLKIKLTFSSFASIVVVMIARWAIVDFFTKQSPLFERLRAKVERTCASESRPEAK
jgi:hypothetical protein